MHVQFFTYINFDTGILLIALCMDMPMPACLHDTPWFFNYDHRPLFDDNNNNIIINNICAYLVKVQYLVYIQLDTGEIHHNLNLARTEIDKFINSFPWNYIWRHLCQWYTDP